MAHDFLHGTTMMKVLSTFDGGTFKLDVYGPNGPAGYGLSVSAASLGEFQRTPAGEGVTVKTLEKQVAADYVRYIDEVLPAIRATEEEERKAREGK